MKEKKRPAGQIALTVLSIVLYFIGLVLLLAVPLYSLFSDDGTVLGTLSLFGRNGINTSLPSVFLCLGAVLLAVALSLGTEALVLLFSLRWRGMSLREYAEKADSISSEDTAGEGKKGGHYPKVEGTLLLKGAFFLVALTLSILFLCLVPASFRWINSFASNLFAGIGEGGAAFLVLFGCAALAGGVSNSWSLMTKLDWKEEGGKAPQDGPKD